MKRIPIAHVVFPRLHAARPVHEFVWEAVRAFEDTKDLAVDVYVPVPATWLRNLQGWARRQRGLNPWPADLQSRLEALSPRPILVPYVPIPRRSIESAATAVAARLVRQPRARRPAMVQGSFLDDGGYVATVVGRVMDCPSVVVAHGSDVRAAMGEISGIGRTKRAKEALRHAHRVVAVSHHLAQDLVQLGVRAEVLPFTSSSHRFPSAGHEAKADPPEVLFAGRINPAKGVDTLLDAFAQLSHPTAVLRLVGPVSSGWDVDNEIAKRGLTGKVQLHGEVTQAELSKLYARSTCTALVSRSEGLPCVLVESLLVGRPVVASDVGGVRELVNDTNGRLVPKEDPGATARALQEILSADPKRFRPATLATTARPFAWESIGPRLASLTRSLIGSDAV